MNVYSCRNSIYIRECKLCAIYFFPSSFEHVKFICARIDLVQLTIWSKAIYSVQARMHNIFEQCSFAVLVVMHIYYINTEYIVAAAIDQIKLRCFVEVVSFCTVSTVLRY